MSGWPKATTDRHEHYPPLTYWPIVWNPHLRRWRCTGCGRFTATTPPSRR